jgi:hypothetical protein
MGRLAPFLATIQALSKTCVFLSNKRSKGCFVLDAPPMLLAPTIFIIALFSWVSVGNRLRLVLKLAKEGQNVTRAEIFRYRYLKYLPSYKNYWYSIQWRSGNTGLVRWNSRWIDSLSDRRILFQSVFIIYLEYAKVPHVFFFNIFFTACFLLVNLLVKIYCVSRKISYNRNPVK